MKTKGGSSVFSAFAAKSPRFSRGTAVWLVTALLIAGLSVSPALAAYVDIIGGGNVILAAPTAGDDTYAVDEDAQLSVPAPGVLGNDTDPETDPLTAVLDSGTTHGALNLSSDGSFTYDPALDFYGTDSFTYHASDGTGDSNIATVTITVNPVNDAPQGADKTITIDEDAPYTFSAADFGFTDPKDAPPNIFQAVKITTSPSAGTLELATVAVSAGDFVAVADLPNLVFTPALNANGAGADSFTFQVQDDGGTAPGGDLDPDAKTITFNISPVNDAPVLTIPPSASGNEGSAIAFTATASDVDNLPQDLTFSLDAGAPGGASIHPTTGAFSWTPTEAQGPDVYPVTVRVTDSGTPPLDDFETITITVNEVNTAPVVQGIADQSGAEGTLFTYDAQATDADSPAQAITYSLQVAPASATIDEATGVISWTPGESDGGTTPVFTVRATDNGAPALYGEDTFTVTVSEVNLAPVLGLVGNQSVNETELLSFTASASDGDLPSQTLAFSLGAGAPAGADITSGGLFTWTPSEAQGGSSYPVTIQVSDGLATDFEAISITVTDTNVPPLPDNETFNTSEDIADFAIQGSDLLLGDTDTDLPPQTLAIVGAVEGSAVNGNVTYNPNQGAGGRFHFVPASNFFGQASFAYRITDGTATADGLVTINVAPENDLPVADSQSVSTAEDTPLAITLTGSDVEGSPLGFVAISDPPNGALTGVAPDLIYTPDANYTGPDSFTFMVNDGTADSAPATISITVAPRNDPPVAIDDNYAVTEDVPLMVAAPGVMANDSDPDSAIAAVLGNLPVHGTVNFSTDGGFTYTPAADYFGMDSFTYTASDGTLASAAATVTLNIGAVNDVPVANSQAVVTDEDLALGILLTGSDVETPAISLLYSVMTPPANGSLSGTAPDLTYTPNLNFNGADSFTFIVNDSTADSALATVSITVNSLNDAPVALGNSYFTNEDAVLNVTAPGVLGNDSDVDTLPQALTAVLVTDGAKGSVVLNPDGSFTYTPTLNLNGPDSFTYKVNDGTLDSNVATINITINAINDSPVLNPIPAQTVDEMTLLQFTASALDPEVPPQELTYSLAGMPPGGTVPAGAAIDSASGVITWTPTEAQGPSDTDYVFQVCVTDGLSSHCLPVTVEVNEVNLPPVGNNDSFEVLEDSSLNLLPVLANDTDPDVPANTLNWTGVSGVSHGSLTLGGTISYTPAANFNGSDGFTYSVTDGSLSDPAAVAITVLSVNDAPAGVPATVSLNEDTFRQFSAADFTLTDINDAPAPNALAAVKISTLPAKGVLTLSDVPVSAGQVIPAGSLGNLKFTPAANANGAPYTSFTFQVQDNGGTANGGIDLDPTPRLLTINVNSVPDNPVGVADSYVINLSKTLPFTVAAPGVLANDSDGDTFANWTLSVLTQPAHGTVVLNQNGSFTYTQTGTPPLDYVDTFTYRITDTTPATTRDVTVTLTVDRERPPMANWELPFAWYNWETPYVLPLQGTTTLKASVPATSDVVGIRFTLALGSFRQDLGISGTFTVSSGKKIFTMVVPNSIFPIGLPQVRADSVDDAGNEYMSDPADLEEPPYPTYPITFFRQSYGYVFLPLIRR